MKKKLLMFVVGLMVLISLFLVYIKMVLPQVGEPEMIDIAITEERVSRGRYLANHVTLCIDCHSTRDWARFSGPLVLGTEGKGGEVFNEDLGFPGRYVAPNITPSNLENWTDGEIFRAITTGVNKNNHALFPIMPYKNFGSMAREDLYAIIAYIRTLKPIAHITEPSVSNFPFNFIINSMPTEAVLAEKVPSKTDVLAYGQYLTRASGCFDCHTNQKDGKRIGEAFAGGFEFKLPNGSVVRSSNLTPHETGIKYWTEEAFINRFKIYKDTLYTSKTIEKGANQTVMPWTMYAGMTEADLGAIFTYLQSLAPKEHVVEAFSYTE